MRILKLTAVAVLLGGLSFGAVAAPIGFTFNAGQVTSIASDAPSDITNFQVGEDLLLTFTIESTTPDSDPNVGAGRFYDPLGTITVTGATSGHVLALAPGVDFDLDNSQRFELDDPDPAFPDPAPGAFILDNDTDLEAPAGFTFLTNPDDLAQSIVDLQALLDANGVFQGFRNQESGAGGGINLIQTNTAGDPISVRMLDFGPVTTDAVRQETSLTFNAGPVIFLSPDAPAEYSGFEIGEDILLTLTIDTTVPDQYSSSISGRYEDALGTIRLVGANSGTTVDLLGGVDLEFDRVDEFDVDDVDTIFTLGSTFLDDDTDLLATIGLVSDPDDLAQILMELQARIGPNFEFFGFENRSPGSSAGVDAILSRDESGDAVETRILTFGPVPATIPLPGALPLLLVGLGAFAAFRVRARRG